MAEEFDVEEISDEELAALAMAADPDAPIDEDAVPFRTHLEDYPDLLPAWYMPAPGGFSRTRGRAMVVRLVVLALIVVNACGLCVTNGHLELPF